MRSGRGKCPQCKEIIVVDLDAPEIRCPLCNALLKKSQKTVEEVRAEEEARVAAALAREKALAEEAAEAEAPVEEAPEAAVEETPSAEVAEEAVEAVPAETAEEAPDADVDISLPEEAAEEVPADEIGLTDEELAAMDEVPPAEEDASAEAAEPVDEIGLSDEELAAMDDGIPTEEETAEDDVASADIDVPEQTEDGAEEADLDIPVSIEVEEPAAEETPDEEAAEEETPAEEEPLGGEVDLSDEGDVPEIPVEEAPVEAVSDETPVEETAEEPAPEVEEAPAGDEPVEIELEDHVAEEDLAEEGVYVPTEEDMAFAASLSEGTKREPGKGFVAVVDPTANPVKKQKEKKERKEKAPKGENKMSGTAIYKKPVAVLMMIFALIGAAFSLLYINILVFGLISEDVGLKVLEIATKIMDVLPKADMLLPLIFGGVLVLISVLGLTGQRGKAGFLFALLAALVYLAVQLFGGADPVIKVEFITKILENYGEYVSFAIYGLLLLAAIFFAVSIGSGREDLEIGGGTVVLPIIYMLLAVVGYVAAVILPKFVSFTVSDDMIKYAIFGIVGLSILLTLIGVHSATASRGANAWLLFAATMIAALLTIATLSLVKFVPAEFGLNVYPEIALSISPSIIFFPLIGYAVSDLRN